MDFVLAVVAGVLVVLSMTLNSGLGLRIGVFRSAAVNYFVGLAGAMGLWLVLGGTHPGDLGAPWWAWWGGALGVGIVVASNVVLPRIPVMLAAILIVVGQLGTGLVLDVIRTGLFHPWQLAGAGIVLVGVLIGRLGQKPQ